MEITPTNQRIKGTYYIRVRSAGWYVWYKFYEDGKSQREKVDQKATRDLGFINEMSVEQAKAHCVQLNKERSLRREKIRRAAKRVTELKTINETLFPQSRVEEFQALLSLHEVSGNVATFEFSELKPNSGLKDDLFDFKAPADVEIVRAPVLSRP